MNAATLAVMETRDREFISRLVRENLAGLVTDQVPNVNLGYLFNLPGITFLKVGEGLVIVHANELHTVFPKTLRGRAALDAYREVLAWLWENTGYRELTSYCYSNRPEILWFARQLGFSQSGPVPDGTTIGGLPVGRYNFKLSRPCP